MSRYLGIYQNLAAVQSALNNSELSKPYVALYENNTNIDYNSQTLQHTFTIVSTISNTTIIINGVERSSFTTAEGTVITWSVSKNGYVTQNGTYTLNTDHTETVTLEEEIDYSTLYFTVKALGTGTIVVNSPDDYYLASNDSPTFLYKLNNNTWQTLLSEANSTINVNNGDIIQFKGTGFYCGSGHPSNSIFYDSTVNYEVYGNILSLIYGDNFQSADIAYDADPDNWATRNADIGTNTFWRLFDSDTHIISAANLILPDPFIDGCYWNMFNGCTSLTTAPALPGTILTDGCYSMMFYGCTSLTTAPILPATTLVSSISDNEHECYYCMFRGCSNLNYIKCLATDISAGGLTNWVNGVAASGTFVKATSMNNWTTGDNGIPSGWNVQNAS